MCMIIGPLPYYFNIQYVCNTNQGVVHSLSGLLNEGITLISINGIHLYM